MVQFRVYGEGVIPMENGEDEPVEDNDEVRIDTLPLLSNVWREKYSY